MPKKITQEDFILKSNKIHKNKYDYSKVKYYDCKTKVCIICPEHGEFWQSPDKHINSKNGCPKCKNEKTSERCKKSKEDFIKDAIKIHGNKYNYSKTEYVNNKVKTCIICPEHGEFWQTPHAHLSGQGCPLCKNEKARKQNNKGIDKFIFEAKQIHGEKYNYSKVNYINTNTKVCIICPKHGEFWQKPSKHLIGQGCCICNHNGHIIETKLYNELKETFEKEKIIHCYRNKNILGTQELDIYFPEYNIGIEVQGEQHFKPIDFGKYGKEKSKQIFKEIKERDRRKKEICEKNGIKLLYFNFNHKSFLGEKIYNSYEKLINEINQIIKKEDEKN